MFNLDKFISDSVTFRPVSMFAPDIEANVTRTCPLSPTKKNEYTLNRRSRLYR